MLRLRLPFIGLGNLICTCSPTAEARDLSSRQYRFESVQVHLGVAEQAVAADSKSVGAIREGSSPFARTMPVCWNR